MKRALALLWQLHRGHYTVLLPVVMISVFFTIITIAMVTQYDPGIDNLGIPWAIVFAVIVLIGMVNFAVHETIEVDLDVSGDVCFKRLFNTVKVSPRDLHRIRLYFFGITAGRIILETTHRRMFFCGSPGFPTPLLKLIKRGKWDRIALTGCLFGGRLPDDESLWELFIVLQILNRELKVADPYIQYRMDEHRKIMKPIVSSGDASI